MLSIFHGVDKMLPNWDHDNEEWINTDWDVNNMDGNDDPTCVWDMVEAELLARDPINYDEVPF